MEKFFGLKKHGTTVKTELLAGITTFMAMAYILMVNANMFANPFGDGTNVLGVSYGAIYVATALSAVVGTVLIGLLSNLPLAQASGMGLNAFFVYSVCVGMGFSYANALVMVLIDGIVFILLTVTGLRRVIFDAIPKAVKAAISAGIGLFIAFLGLQNAGIIVNSLICTRSTLCSTKTSLGRSSCRCSSRSSPSSPSVQCPRRRSRALCSGASSAPPFSITFSA